MRCLGKIMVALVAALMVVVTSTFGAMIWYLWQNPFFVNVECSAEALRWEGSRYVCEVQFDDAGLEQARIWRRMDTLPAT